MTPKGPEPLSKILEKIWKKIEKQKEEKTEIAQVLDKLNLVLGKNISSHAKPYKIYKKKLIIVVNSPVYLQELLFKKEKIIEAVNQTFGKEKIKEVNFRVGVPR
ncbi:MAG: DUF721 domain-containing protein [Candidatus Omnitrophica bacterium]|nr:DUF721 domain-containing protein [Candidatus Omnitrophota bacterium]MBU1047520.1 DUF721 domain-containing protein [Candidatus Omnitrophota bacterium]MBU1630600.1 DUF721 domain-containing protein [Candidatus Omnitrophota bacterium]MBU1767343.1 DUF721 domain-containing protein [Candidatus Omnitrophota bacterium]MBU1888883.1 DUF721 domain-containing protein [Candidatus Omnitrophota bacterium]